MAFKLGLSAKLYRDTGSAWDEVTNVKNLTLNMDKGEADVSTRGNGGWKATIAALKDASVEFDMVWDLADADLTAIRDAYLNNTVVRFIILDGAIDTAAAGCAGLKASFMVTKFSIPQNLEEAIMCQVTMKPTYSATAPAWVTTPITWAA
jgi:predicted secreted protein